VAVADRIVELPVLGMVRSTSFANNIARGVRRRQGVIEATVSVDTEEISILFDTEKATIRGLVGNLRQLGYDVAHTKIELPITGMNTKEDAHNVEKGVLEKVEGVLEASVNISTDLLTAEYMPRYSTIKDVVAAVEAAGYGAVVPEEYLKEEEKKEAPPPTVVEEPPKEEIPPAKIKVPDVIPPRPVDKPVSVETPAPVKPPAVTGERIIDLPILGMTSVDCALIIENGLRRGEGVIEVTVSFVATEASILFDTEKTTPKTLVENIRKIGYDVDIEKLKAKFA